MKAMLLAALFLFAGTASLHAQEKTRLITGLVRDAATHQPVGGVSVTVKGAKSGSGSQEDGIFYIDVKPADNIVVFAHPDYETQEVRLSHESEYNVELHKKRH